MKVPLPGWEDRELDPVLVYLEDVEALWAAEEAAVKAGDAVALARAHSAFLAAVLGRHGGVDVRVPLSRSVVAVRAIVVDAFPWLQAAGGGGAGPPVESPPQGG